MNFVALKEYDNYLAQVQKRLARAANVDQMDGNSDPAKQKEDQAKHKDMLKRA